MRGGGEGVKTAAFRNHFRLVLVTGSMVLGCPHFSVLFCTRSTEDNRLEGFARTDLGPAVLAFVVGRAVRGNGLQPVQNVVSANVGGSAALIWSEVDMIAV